MKRILLAALLGGLAIFIWTAVAHMFLPIGGMGISTLPNEDIVLQSLADNIPAEGMYMFPGWDMSKAEPEEEAWYEKHRNGPAGILIYKPKGGEAMPPSMLINEFITNFLAVLIMAFVAASLTGSYGRRVLLLTLFGFFAWFSISASYWIWYGFPAAAVIAEGIDIIVGALVASLVVAIMVPAPAAPAKA
jgi:hypothetical protein